MASRGCVMVVDDEKMLEEMLQMMLHVHQYETASFNDPRNALNYFRENSSSVDLVVADLTMPGLTGIELAKELLSIRKDVPIIIITGYMDQMPAEYAEIAPRIRAVLPKPVTKQQLQEAVQAIIGDRRTSPASTN